MRYKIFLLAGAFLLSSFAISQNSYLKEDDNTKILKEIEELKKGQDKISKEVSKLKASNPSGNKPAVAKGGKKNVPIGNSIVLGKADAPVTIVKWTDFQ